MAYQMRLVGPHGTGPWHEMYCAADLWDTLREYPFLTYEIRIKKTDRPELTGPKRGDKEDL